MGASQSVNLKSGQSPNTPEVPESKDRIVFKIGAEFGEEFWCRKFGAENFDRKKFFNTINYESINFNEALVIAKPLENKAGIGKI